jgi:YHS domain-containing protein
MKKPIFTLASVLLTWTLILIACSAPKSPININKEGVALKGYDTVAYFTEGKPVKGQKEFQHDWQDATWLFASEQHLKMFRENPEKYAPQYGGY